MSKYISQLVSDYEVLGLLSTNVGIVEKPSGV